MAVFFSQNNKIEAINCRGLSKLEVISLADNNLASIHGFEGCISVVSLDLCNNKITRIGEATQFINIILCYLFMNELQNHKGPYSKTAGITVKSFAIL